MQIAIKILKKCTTDLIQFAELPSVGVRLKLEIVSCLSFVFNKTI